MKRRIAVTRLSRRRCPFFFDEDDCQSWLACGSLGILPGLASVRPRRAQSLRIRNLLIVALVRNGTVIPWGEFLIEPDFHRLGVFIGVTLLKRIVTGENTDGCFQALFCARPCHGLAG